MMSVHRAPSLLQAQQWLQRSVLAEDEPVGADGRLVVAGDAEEGLRIYREAYRLRLLEVLRDDYPLLHAVLGEDAFARLGLRYLSAYPSRSPSARWFGRDLRELLADRPALADLAGFEWLQGECFDAADADVVVLEDLAGLPPDAWPELRLTLHPSLRRRSGDHDLAPLLRGESTDEPARLTGARTWLLWRRQRQVHWRLLDDDEADALQAVAMGAGFGGLCERLCAWHEPERVALRAAALLKRWIVDGLVSGLRSAPMS